jgi:hypothetical protein
MTKHPKTDRELLDDIRRCGRAIDEIWDGAFSLSGKVNLDGLQQIESNANALTIFCKLLRQRLVEGQPTTEGE